MIYLNWITLIFRFFCHFSLREWQKKLIFVIVSLDQDDELDRQVVTVIRISGDVIVNGMAEI